MAPKCMQRLLNIRPPVPPLHPTLSPALAEENISLAEAALAKWDPDSPDSDATRALLRCVGALHSAMLFLTSSDCREGPESRSRSLVRAQGLMQAAMRRLERELRRMLSDHDPEHETGDLPAVARAMVSAGYGKECVAAYKAARRSAVHEGLRRLGFEHLAPSQVQKLDWGALELRIRGWLAASGPAVRTLFAGERALCDRVFEGASDAIRESCFADVAREAAVGFLGFAESASRTKKSPERLFRILDMLGSVSDLWADVEAVFSFESTSAVRAQALASLLKLAEAARATVSEFESAIRKEGSKTGVPGGGVHPLTRYAMNYIVFLADYEETLAGVYADFPMQMPPLPESFLDSAGITSAPPSPSSFGSGISLRFAWLLALLLCKLDGNAELYKEPALSYLFLANNLQYMINKVRESRLGFLLGSGWIAKHSSKTRHYAASYERIGWARVAASIPSPEAAAFEPPAVVDERVRAFNAGFEEAVRVQRGWVVADPKMNAEMRSSVVELLVPPYREFYDVYRPTVAVDVANRTALRFAPEDVVGRVMELFSGSDTGNSGSGSRSGSGSARSWSKSSLWSEWTDRIIKEKKLH